MLDEVKRIMISGFMPLCRWAGQKSADHICIDKIYFGGVLSAPIGTLLPSGFSTSNQGGALERRPGSCRFAGPFCHCRGRYDAESSADPRFERFVSGQGVWQKPK
jgi:hypothetical protein